eukprot:g4720.t1
MSDREAKGGAASSSPQQGGERKKSQGAGNKKRQNGGSKKGSGAGKGTPAGAGESAGQGRGSKKGARGRNVANSLSALALLQRLHASQPGGKTIPRLQDPEAKDEKGKPVLHCILLGCKTCFGIGDGSEAVADHFQTLHCVMIEKNPSLRAALKGDGRSNSPRQLASPKAVQQQQPQQKQKQGQGTAGATGAAGAAGAGSAGGGGPASGAGTAAKTAKDAKPAAKVLTGKTAAEVLLAIVGVEEKRGVSLGTKEAKKQAEKVAAGLRKNIMRADNPALHCPAGRFPWDGVKPISKEDFNGKAGQGKNQAERVVEHYRSTYPELYELYRREIPAFFGGGGGGGGSGGRSGGVVAAGASAAANSAAARGGGSVASGSPKATAAAAATGGGGGGKKKGATAATSSPKLAATAAAPPPPLSSSSSSSSSAAAGGTRGSRTDGLARIEALHEAGSADLAALETALQGIVGLHRRRRNDPK